MSIKKPDQNTVPNAVKCMSCGAGLPKPDMKGVRTCPKCGTQTKHISL